MALSQYLAEVPTSFTPDSCHSTLDFISLNLDVASKFNEKYVILKIKVQNKINIIIYRK